MPMWRNWYMRNVEGVVVERSCGFDSHHRHQTINSSMRKILLLSVPHTGTVFVRNYINDVLKVSRCKHPDYLVTDDGLVYTNIHCNSPQRLENEKPNNPAMYGVKNCNVIIPIRNPIDNAISCLGRGHSNLVYCAENWRVLMEMYPLCKRVFWVDVWAPEQNRRNMMLKLNEFLGIEPNQKLFDDYVNNWKVVNNRTEEQIEIAERRTSHFKFDLLDFAVEWYEQKKIELNRLYTPLPTD